VLEFLGLRPWHLDKFVPRNRKAYAPIDPSLRARLSAVFAEPNARLARLLGRDFGWSSPGPEARTDDTELAAAHPSQGA
jgi:hypothetical protein